MNVIDQITNIPREKRNIMSYQELEAYIKNHRTEMPIEKFEAENKKLEWEKGLPSVKTASDGNQYTGNFVPYKKNDDTELQQF